MTWNPSPEKLAEAAAIAALFKGLPDILGRATLPDDVRGRCWARGADGDRCRRVCVVGDIYCFQHSVAGVEARAKGTEATIARADEAWASADAEWRDARNVIEAFNE